MQRTEKIDALHRSVGAARNGGFVVSVPALPGCISQGDTREAIAVYVEDCREAGDPVPILRKRISCS